MTRRQVLFVAHRVPWPADKGDRLRSHAILRHLAARHDVWLAAFGDDGDPARSRAAGDALRPLCAGVRVVPLPGRLRALRGLVTGRPLSCEVFSSAELDAWVRDVAERVPLDGALAYSAQSAPIVLSVPAGRHVVDLVDVDSAKWAARWKRSRNPVWWLEARRVRALEARCLAEADLVTVVSQREADRLSGELALVLGASERLRVVPMGVDLAEFAARERDPGGARIGFVGAMDYPPNAEGAFWFAREVLPRIREERPEAEFVVIGRHPPAALAGLPGVTATGWLDDIRPAIASCAAGVVPILTSHGVQTKALVAMAMGVPQVVASAVVGGLEAEPEHDLLAAGDAREFALQVLRLLDNPAERARLAARGRAFAEARCDWSRILAPLEEALLPGGAARPSPVLPGRVSS